MSVRFIQSKVSDQKRLVRGEHWLLARTLLRARDGVHHAKWRIMTLAGGAPAGEMAAVRELMPKARIIAVDRDAECLSAAIDAGADDVVQCDLAEFSSDIPKESPIVRRGNRKTFPHQAIVRLGEFDVINLDFCCGVGREMRQILNVYSWLVTSRGVIMVTFSYGRDVAEMFTETLWDWRRKAKKFNETRLPGYSDTHYRPFASALERFTAAQMPEGLIGRLCYAMTPGQANDVVSVLLYKGAQMPMCSVLIQPDTHKSDLSFVKIGHGDFEVAVTYPDAAALYDCPRERIDSFRRRFAAMKAARTREANQLANDEPLLEAAF